MELSKIRSAIEGLRARMRELDLEISNLETERAELVCLPLPYDDFVEWSLRRYDDLADSFNEEFYRHFILGDETSMKPYYMAKRTGHSTLDDFKAVFSGGIPLPLEKPNITIQTEFPLSKKAFFFVFKDLIKDAMRRAMDTNLKAKWPKEVGPARAERIAILETMEAKISYLEIERDTIKADLASVV